MFLTLGGSEGLTGKCTYFVRVVEGKVWYWPVARPKCRGQEKWKQIIEAKASLCPPLLCSGPIALSARTCAFTLAHFCSQVNPANVENEINFGTLEGSSLVVLSRILSEVCVLRTIV